MLEPTLAAQRTSTGHVIALKMRSATVTTNCIASYDNGALDPKRLGLDPKLQQWFALQPTPNNYAAVGATAVDGLNTAAYIFNVQRLDPQRDFVFKIDHRFNEANTVFVPYSWGRQDTPNDTANGGDPVFPGLASAELTVRKPLNWAANYRHVLSNTMVNELVVGANLFTFPSSIQSSINNFPQTATAVHVTWAI
jgi:hypothetical protein